VCQLAQAKPRRENNTKNFKKDGQLINGEIFVPMKTNKNQKIKEEKTKDIKFKIEFNKTLQKKDH
jgi:hypothetical protein